MRISPYWRNSGICLGSLINIYLCDLFVFMAESNTESYADDTTLYVCEKNRQMCKVSWNLNL